MFVQSSICGTVADTALILSLLYFVGKAFKYDIFNGLVSDKQMKVISFLAAVWLLLMEKQIGAIPLIVYYIYQRFE